jgi:hypothetical protein
LNRWIKNLLLLPLLVALPAVVQAQYQYTNINGSITITLYTGSGGAVTIPSTILVNGVNPRERPAQPLHCAYGSRNSQASRVKRDCRRARYAETE